MMLPTRETDETRETPLMVLSWDSSCSPNTSSISRGGRFPDSSTTTTLGLEMSGSRSIPSLSSEM